MVRRLTPIECERLQGFPDGWTRLGHDGKEISDTRRYQMLGNSQERLGNTIASRQSMSKYYLLTGAFVAAMSQLQQARGMTQDFYQQSQIDVEIRVVRNKMTEERQLLERFR